MLLPTFHGFYDIILVSNWVGDLMIKQQQTMILSVYAGIYDLVVSKDNLLRKIN